MDLSKSIKINENYEITYARLLLVSLVTIFEFLGVLCGNGWVLVPEAFFLVSNAFLALEKRIEEESDYQDLLEEIHIIKERLNEQDNERVLPRQNKKVKRNKRKPKKRNKRSKGNVK